MNTREIPRVITLTLNSKDYVFILHELQKYYILQNFNAHTENTTNLIDRFKNNLYFIANDIFVKFRSSPLLLISKTDALKLIDSYYNHKNQFSKITLKTSQMVEAISFDQTKFPILLADNFEFNFIAALNHFECECQFKTDATTLKSLLTRNRLSYSSVGLKLILARDILIPDHVLCVDARYGKHLFPEPKSLPTQQRPALNVTPTPTVQSESIFKKPLSVIRQSSTSLTTQSNLNTATTMEIPNSNDTPTQLPSATNDAELFFGFIASVNGTDNKRNAEGHLTSPPQKKQKTDISPTKAIGDEPEGQNTTNELPETRGNKNKY